MHLTLKKEATKPAAANVLQQQGRFDAFVERYHVRAIELHQPPQSGRAEHDDVIETLASCGSDKSFDECVATFW